MTKSSKSKPKHASASRSKGSSSAIRRLRVMPPTAAAISGEPRNRDDWVKMTFRVPPPVEEFVEVTCAKRRITLQTLMLQLLRNLGGPITDQDLKDNRKGRSFGAANGHTSQSLKSPPRINGRDLAISLEQLGDPRFWEQVAQQVNAQPADQMPATFQVFFVNFASDKAR
jgi:hypothetical protein